MAAKVFGVDFLSSGLIRTFWPVESGSFNTRTNQDLVLLVLIDDFECSQAADGAESIGIEAEALIEVFDRIIASLEAVGCHTSCARKPVFHVLGLGQKSFDIILVTRTEHLVFFPCLPSELRAYFILGLWFIEHPCVLE